MTSRHPRELLDLEEVERRLKPFERRYLGVRAIPIERVVGTDGWSKDFSRDFWPRRSLSPDRLRSLKTAYPEGGFPPITTYKLGETYFVIDGHHRLALARRYRAAAIDADVVELVARVPLPADADMQEVVLRELERVFLEDSGLADARPGVRISAARPAVYLELLENVQIHGYHLMRAENRVVPQREIAADWYDRVYAPAAAALERARDSGVDRRALEADLFLLLHRRRRETFPDCGCPPLEETVPTLATKRRRRLFRRA